MKVLVMGEVCSDVFIYGRCERLNSEAPSPVFIPIRQVRNYGMAGNTYSNLEHLGANVFLADDITEDLVKLRYVDEKSNYTLLRVDDEKMLDPIERDDIHNITGLEEYDVIVISDYNKGLLTEDVLEHLFLVTKNIGIKTFMSTKKIIGEWANDCDYIKLSHNHYLNPLHNDFISSELYREKLIITLGNGGCQYKDTVYSVKAHDVVDIVGAGDTFLAGLACGYNITKNIETGIELANLLASDVVTKQGVSLPSSKIMKDFLKKLK